MDSVEPARTGSDFDFSQLFETELAMFSVAGPDGYFRNVNPAFERLLGRSRQQLLEHSLFEFVLPADIPKALQGLYELDAGLREVAFETRWVHADGSVRWLAWVARRDASAQHWYATARDVTEYREMQAALERVQQRLSLAMSVAQPAAGTGTPMKAASRWTPAANCCSRCRREADTDTCASFCDPCIAATGNG